MEEITDVSIPSRKDQPLSGLNYVEEHNQNEMVRCAQDIIILSEIDVIAFHREPVDALFILGQPRNLLVVCPPEMNHFLW